MGERIYVACLLSQGLQEIIANWREKYSALPINWYENESLHVTLIPPWEEEDVAGVIKTLQASRVPIQPFTFTLEQITFGPPDREPRVIQTIGQTPNELVRLKTHIETTLRSKPTNGNFSLHVTLANFHPKHFKNLPKTIAQSIVWQEYISGFSLVQSIPQVGRSASYKLLAEISL